MQLSVVLPVYNEKEVAGALYRELRTILDSVVKHSEIIFVDDGSVDGTVPELLGLARSDPRLIIIELTRNFGNAMAIATGLEFATGEWVVTMDSDFEDKPEHIADLYNKALEGYDVVYAVRESTHKSFAKDIGSRLFYALLSRMADFSMPSNSGNFAIMHRDVVQALRKMTERTRYFAGLRNWVGYRQIGLDLPRGKRLAGDPKQSFSRLFKQALDAVFAFSTAPLRLLTFLGITAFLFALGLALVLVVVRFKYSHWALEWMPSLISTVFFGGVQLIGLGILGEYLGRIYNEVRGRPVSIVKKITNVPLDRPVPAQPEVLP
jgi:dolichol-phosphate mannosyltransferase